MVVLAAGGPPMSRRVYLSHLDMPKGDFRYWHFCMDRPCVASRISTNGGWSCASVSGPCMERLCSWPSWISARTRSHFRKGPERPLVPPDHGYDGETVSPSPQSNSQTSVGSSAFFECFRD